MNNQAATLWKKATNELLKVELQTHHPFRYVALNTHSDFPECRWVVTRAINDNYHFLFYTDSRAPKVRQILENEKVGITCYHPELKLQIRIKGLAQVIQSGPLFEQHLAVAKNHPTDYTSIHAPGTELAGPAVHKEDLDFSLICVMPIAFDVLLLNSGGHLRAQYKYAKDEWTGFLVTP